MHQTISATTVCRACHPYIDTADLYTQNTVIQTLVSLPTVGFKIHAAKDERADVLGLHVALEVDKDGGQVVVGVVGDARGGDGLEELGLRELSGQSAQVLVYQGAQWDAGGEDEEVILKSCPFEKYLFCFSTVSVESV